MKLQRKILLAAIMLILSTSIAFPYNIRCFARRNVPEEFKQASAIFSGTAIAEEYREPKLGNDWESKGSKRLVVRFEVERWWKGSSQNEVVLYTSEMKLADGTTWFMAEDYRFQIGEKYLVYAFGSSEQLQTNVCTRTAKWEEAKGDLQELGEGRVPQKQ